jgi:hypothetical protein
VAFALGLLTVADHNAGHLPVETVVVWYFIPVVDCFRQMLSRWMAGESPLKPDNNHFHHRLSRLFGPHAARFIYVGLVAGTSLIATFEPRFDAVYLGFLALAYAALLRPDLIGWHPKALSAAGTLAKAPKPAPALQIVEPRPKRAVPLPLVPPGGDINKTLH